MDIVLSSTLKRRMAKRQTVKQSMFGADRCLKLELTAAEHEDFQKSHF